MRRIPKLSVLLLAGMTALPAAALEIVLKDGRTLSLAKPWVKKGNQAVLTLSDGQFVSIRADEIDEARTAALAAAPPPAATTAPSPVPSPPMTPAEAALQKSSRKATVIITDQDVGRVLPEGERRAPSDGKVEFVGVTSTRGGTGYTLSASAVNTGGTEVTGLTVSVEAVGEDNKILASVFARLARTTLGSGEKTALNAQVQIDKPVVNFRLVPNWTVKTAVKPAAAGEGKPKAAGDGKPAGSPGEGGEAAKPEAPKPTPKPEPTPEPTPVPRPDYAAPPMNAPVGAPSAPGGTYVPQPSSDQPKPPGGG